MRAGKERTSLGKSDVQRERKAECKRLNDYAAGLRSHCTFSLLQVVKREVVAEYVWKWAQTSELSSGGGTARELVGEAAQLATLPTHVWGSSTSTLQHVCTSETPNSMETESRLAGARNQ